MRRKDYERIAGTLAGCRGVYDDDVLDTVIEAMAGELATANKRFDYARFVAIAKGEK